MLVDLTEYLNEVRMEEFSEPALLFPGMPEARAIHGPHRKTWMEADPETGVGVPTPALHIRAPTSGLNGAEVGDRVGSRSKNREWAGPDGRDTAVGGSSR